jgi:hypothetical protein
MVAETMRRPVGPKGDVATGGPAGPKGRHRAGPVRLFPAALSSGIASSWPRLGGPEVTHLVAIVAAKGTGYLKYPERAA